MDAPLSAPAEWDDPPENESADRALAFIKACPHTKGELAAENKTLGSTWLEWEEKLTRHIFGTLTSDGRRQYETVYVEMPKKSGKSHYAAAVMLYLLVADGEYGGELYSAAYKKDQAKVVWSIALSMAKNADWLNKRLDLSKEWKNQIICPALESVYQPITRKAVGQHGFNPSAVAFDELHTQPDRDLWDTIDDSMGARREPLLFAITNSGTDRQSICYKQREYAMQVNDGEFEDPTFFGVVYGTTEDADPWEEETWRRANPGLGTTVRVEWMRGKAEQARRQPSKQNAFRRWQLGQWTQATTRWLDPEVWKQCEEEYSLEDRVGEDCYGGLDLGQVRDLTAWVLLFQDPDDPQLVRPICRVWCPQARMTDDENPYREVYQAWARDGHLNVIQGVSINPAEVKPDLLRDARTFGMTDMAMDRYQGIQLSQELEEELGEGRVAGMGQGYSSMTGPCTELERRMLADPPKIRHNGHPVLTWAIQNVALKERSEGDKRMPTKDSEDAIIDPVVALLMALDRAMRHEDHSGDGPSVYAKRAEGEGSVLRSL